ncbi:MAG: hypothetical protein EOP89_04375 [Lysobacteraceae bacterium]|nr:MAG: hypothetical protein EOP89_04375 [Xanthomonadaceae bacterium]
MPSPQAVAPIDDNEGEREGEEALPDERAIPADLDLPLAAFHPDALPEVPREPVRPVLPLRPPALAAAEPTPVPSESRQPVAPPAPAGPSEVPSIESLLDRLERSTRWKARA